MVGLFATRLDLSGCVCPGVVPAWRELPQSLWIWLDQYRRGDDDGGRGAQ